MKKVYLLFVAVMAAVCSYGQTVPNTGMEAWRTSTSGSASPKSVEAPQGWYGADSMIISLGQALGGLAGVDPDEWKRQVFKETTITHGGTAAAKIMTRQHDTAGLLGIFPGLLSNSSAEVIFSGMTVTGYRFWGGTPVTARPTSVSAWVQYFPGIDSSTGTTGIDSGMLTVQAISNIGGNDSVIGTGIAMIGPSSSWVQITATVNYTLPDSVVDTVRITFSSSRGIDNLDSSTLYVDDITMTTVPQSVGSLDARRVANVYPNPAKGTVYIDAIAKQPGTFTLMAVNGQVAATRRINGSAAVDVSTLAPGMYLYTITDDNGSTVQRGKVDVAK